MFLVTHRVVHLLESVAPREISQEGACNRCWRAIHTGSAHTAWSAASARAAWESSKRLDGSGPARRGQARPRGVIRDPYGSNSEDEGEADLYYGVDPYASRLVRYGLAKMRDGRKAYYREWQVACEVNLVYTMMIWYLPKSKVALYVLSAHPEDEKGYQKITASVDLRRYKYAAKL